MESIYQLWFVREIIHRDPTGDIAEYEDIEKLLGMYSTRENAEAALERAKLLREFVDHPECLEIHTHSINHDNWTDGFITV